MDLLRGQRCCVSGIRETTWDSLGEVPFISLPLQKRQKNLGKPAPVLIAKACLGLQEGGVGTVPNGMGMENYIGKNTQNPTPGCLPSDPWQTSVRVAPSTMNWGFDSSSYKTHSPVPGPVPPRNWHQPLRYH